MGVTFAFRGRNLRETMENWGWHSRCYTRVYGSQPLLAAAAMNATERWQDMVADNLSSASIPGARQQVMSFSSVQAGLASTQPGAANNTYVIPFAGASTNFTQGELKATGNNLDVALDGPGFFGVRMPDGSTAYTRDGEFTLNSQGQLVTKQGYAGEQQRRDAGV